MTEPSMTESGYVRKLTALEKEREVLQEAMAHLKAQAAHRARGLENGAFLLSIILIGLRSLVELAQEIGLLAHVDAGFPWGFWAFCLLLVLPKMIGRVGAAGILGELARGVARRIGGKQDGGAG